LHSAVDALFKRTLSCKAGDGGSPSQLGPPVERKAPIGYPIVINVPEHWIPFVPVHIENQMREIQLQRASLPRILENDPDVPKKVEPRTSLLREGLDLPAPQKYFVHEDKVGRALIKAAIRSARRHL